MKVILLQDIKNYGKKNSVIDVKDGYAKNFLFPNKKAILATKDALEQLTKKQKIESINQEKKISKFLILKEQLENITLNFHLKFNGNKVFGAVTSRQIIDKLLSNHNISLDKKQFINYHNISMLGLNTILIKLHSEIIAKLQVNIEVNK